MPERYEVHPDGTVLDLSTGLEWESAAAVQARGMVTWQEGMDAAAKLGDGWRVPTVAELFAVLDHARVVPASSFPAMLSGWYWSSSSRAGNSAFAWGVYFAYGFVYYCDKACTGYVRCVRRGPLGA